MPDADYVHQLAGVEDVHGFVTRVCFKTGPPGTVGLEAEWFVVDPERPRRTVRLDEVRSALAGVTPPRGSLLTYEPGGQLELSSAAAPDLPSVCRDLAADVAVVRAALADVGLALLGQGSDPLRPPRIQSHGPRYTAMRTFFAAHHSSGGDLPTASRPGGEQSPPVPEASPGEAMMSATAALQVCLDAGSDAADVSRRWHLSNALAPVLLATFANSPWRNGVRTGFASSRAAVWSAIDPGRTAAPQGADPAEAWAQYALAARVMLVRTPDGPWLADPGFTFADWVSGRTSLPRPTTDDLAYHLTTLFPPVRPRGWFEIRYLDALPDGLWQVAAAVTTALVEDRAIAEAAAETAESVAGLQEVAMRCAVADQRLRRAAVRALELACDALPRLGAAAAVPAVERFADTYTLRGRCPADDLVATDDLPAPLTAEAGRDHEIGERHTAVRRGPAPLWPAPT